MKRLKLFVENHSNIPVIHDLKEDPIGKMAGNKKHDNVVCFEYWKLQISRPSMNYIIAFLEFSYQ